jgi:hypothetical protein
LAKPTLTLLVEHTDNAHRLIWRQEFHGVVDAALVVGVPVLTGERTAYTTVCRRYFAYQLLRAARVTCLPRHVTLGARDYTGSGSHKYGITTVRSALEIFR